MFHQKAFVLLATLWLLAVLTLAAGFFALWTERTFNTIQTVQADLQGEIDMYSTQAGVMYLTATQGLTIAGLTVPKTKEELGEEDNLVDKIREDIISHPVDNIFAVGDEISLDDTAYYGYGKARFAIQDEAGLIAVNFMSDDVWSRLLAALGVAYELHGPLVAKYKDYIDIDDYHRLNGAEKEDYTKQNLPPPRNHLLLHPMEMWRVLDWSKQEGIWENSQFRQLTTTLVATAYPNFNTAPALALQVVYNMSPEQAMQMVQFRKTSPFYQQITINQLTGLTLNIDSLLVNYFPSTQLRLTLWYEGGHRMKQVHFNITHKRYKAKPWRQVYTFDFRLLPEYQDKLVKQAKTTVFKNQETGVRIQKSE